VLVVEPLAAPPAPAPVVLVPPALVVVDVASPVLCPPPPVVRAVPPTSPEQPATIDPHTTSDVVQPKCKIPFERRAANGSNLKMARIVFTRRAHRVGSMLA
jgi:hypothetical protein